MDRNSWSTFDSKPGALRAAAVGIGLFAAYYAAGRLGLEVASLVSTVSLIWPATGLAVAILYRFGIWHFPAVLLAAWAVNAPGHQWPVAVGIALGNTAAVVLAVLALKRHRFSPRFDHWSDAGVLLAAAAATMTVSAANGATWLFGAGTIGSPRLLDAFLYWWLGDVSGVLMAAPLLLAAPDFLKSKTIRRHGRYYLTTTAAVTALGVLLFTNLCPLGVWSLVVAFLPILIIVRVAVWHGAGAAALQTSILFGFSVYGLAHGTGAFAYFAPEARAVAAWWYLTAVTVTALAMAGLFGERAALERQFLTGEENYKALVEDNPALICRFNSEGRLAFANETFRRAFGISVGQSAGADFFRLTNLHSDHAFQNRLQLLRVHEPPATAECRIISEDGDRWYRWSARVTRESSGHGIEFHAVGLDVTDQVLADAERRRIEAQAVQSQKLESIGILAGGIAHQFNNLLTSILGNAELAGQLLPPGSEIRPILDGAAESARRAADLTRHLTNFAVRGSQPPGPLDLSELVRGTRDLFTIAVSKRCPLTLDLAECLPPVTADEMRMRQLLMSLVTNAGEAAATTSATVTVRTYCGDYDPACPPDWLLRGTLEAGSYVVLQIEDAGGGMTDAVRDRIFEPFFTTHHPGRGLGLAAVAAIVHDHGGAVTVCSRPGRGTCVRVLLPPHDPVAAAGHPFDPPVHPPDCPYCAAEPGIEPLIEAAAVRPSRSRNRKSKIPGI